MSHEIEPQLVDSPDLSPKFQAPNENDSLDTTDTIVNPYQQFSSPLDLSVYLTTGEEPIDWKSVALRAGEMGDQEGAATLAVMALGEVTKAKFADKAIKEVNRNDIDSLATAAGSIGTSAAILDVSSNQLRLAALDAEESLDGMRRTNLNVDVSLSRFSQLTRTLDSILEVFGSLFSNLQMSRLEDLAAKFPGQHEIKRLEDLVEKFPSYEAISNLGEISHRLSNAAARMDGNGGYR